MSNNVSAIRPQIPVWTFAERVRKVRRDMRMTQEQFADLIGVGLKAYSAWESGKNQPGNIIAVATNLERHTGVDRRWFIGWASDDGPEPDEGKRVMARLRLSLDPITGGTRTGNYRSVPPLDMVAA